jgi:hypothetical protein
MGGPVEVEEGSSSGVSSRCLWGLSPLTGPETGAGVQMGRLMSGEAQRSQLPLAGVVWQRHMAGDLLHNLSLSRMDGELGLPAE